MEAFFFEISYSDTHVIFANVHDFKYLSCYYQLFQRFANYTNMDQATEDWSKTEINEIQHPEAVISIPFSSYYNKLKDNFRKKKNHYL